MSVVEHKSPYGKWKKLDYLLLEAVQILQAETPSHGIPIWHAFNDDANIGFRVVEKMDYAQRTVDKYDEQRKEKMDSKKGKSDAYLGLGRYVEAYAIDGGELPTREEYYLKMAKEQAELD